MGNAPCFAGAAKAAASPAAAPVAAQKGNGVVFNPKSAFGHIKEAPPDPILGTTLLFKADTNPNKVNLGVGAYRTDEGKPYVLPVIHHAEREILAELGTKNDKEYTTIDGLADVKLYCQRLLFSDTAASLVEGRIASSQTLSGTGSLRVCGEFIKTFLAEPSHTIYVSSPTWGNHNAIFETAGCSVKTYPYWDAKNLAFAFDGMCNTLRAAPEGSSILLHACAHNPTGIDPTQAQWKEIANIIKEKGHIAIMDSAYQGYGTGCLDKDAFALRLFESMNLEFFVCQSFAKNLGLYGERIGQIHAVCKSKEEAVRVLSQIKMVIRPMYSSPPIHGAILVQKVLGNPQRYQQWTQELKGMADRILEVRLALRKGLERKGTPGTWNHVTDQIGMFSFTGLTPPQCERMISKHHIYLLKSGRISLAGLNRGNVQYVVDAMDEVVRNCQ